MLMKVINQYIVTYNAALCNLMEVENGRFFIEFNDFNQQQGWKKQIKELPAEDAALLIFV